MDSQLSAGEECLAKERHLHRQREKALQEAQAQVALPEH